MITLLITLMPAAACLVINLFLIDRQYNFIRLLIYVLFIFALQSAGRVEYFYSELPYGLHLIDGLHDYYAVPVILVALVFIVIQALFEPDFKRMIIMRKAEWYKIILSALIGAGVIALPVFHMASNHYSVYFRHTGNILYVMELLTLGVSMAAVEELFFHGTLQGYFEKRMSIAGSALLTTFILFFCYSVMLRPFELVVMGWYLLFMGLQLGVAMVLRLWYGTLPAILARVCAFMFLFLFSIFMWS